MRFMLVHGPLVGPAIWRWVAEALRSSGHDVAVPDLREAAIAGAPQAVVPAALDLTANEPTVLVGHSGGGFFLPSITAGLDLVGRERDGTSRSGWSSPCCYRG